MQTLRRLALAAACLGPAAAAPAQSEEFTLTDDRTWTLSEAPEPGSDEAVIADARRHIADGHPGRARTILDRFIVERRGEGSPWLAAAYRLRGDAFVALDREFTALYDYETVAIEFPGSEEFRIAVERELAIARRYVAGLRLRMLGLRIADSSEVAVELLIRVQERLPGSGIGEEAMITLADFYYDRNNMTLAGEAYDLYILNYPSGPNRLKAHRRRIFAEVLSFSGPEYNTTNLINARIQTREFIRAFPQEAMNSPINEEFIERIDDSLAARQFIVAEWYMGQNDTVSARFTLERIIADYPGSAAAARAAAIMDEHRWEPVVGNGAPPAADTGSEGEAAGTDGETP